MARIIEAGAILGVMGGGERARMFALAAERIGYRVHSFVGEQAAPGHGAAETEVRASFEDADAAVAFAIDCAAVTVLTEHVPLATLRAVERVSPLFPSPDAIATTQNRLLERAFMRERGLPIAPFVAVSTLEEIEDALHEVGVPALAKTAERKPGQTDQFRIDRVRQADQAWAQLGEAPGIVEALVREKRDLSVVAARDARGTVADYGVFECHWRNMILDQALPVELEGRTAEEMRACARQAAEDLGIVGVLCVDFFLAADGQILIHKLTPHPDNAGYLTSEGFSTDQFEQQVRAMCGLPLGAVEPLQPSAMANLMGDAWNDGDPDLAAALAYPDVKVQLYGKTEARPGRKMGHLIALAPTQDLARSRVLNARHAMMRREWPEFLVPDEAAARVRR